MISNNTGKFVLGLTGGIGTGKSTIAEHIVSKGFYHIDADEMGRKLTEKGSPVLDLLEETFANAEYGSDRKTVLNEDGSLNRKKLASIVFSDPAEKDKLDRIMFAKITDMIVSRIREADLPILLDAPLLFEAGLDRLCTKIILITCDMDVRIGRIAKRDDATADEIKARIDSQMDDEEKAKRADCVVDNSGHLDITLGKIDEIIDGLKIVTFMY